ncbi:MAG: hypothetical protein J2O48_09655 [Solirubrobacterales bacterium]|nr:hypothetical protein [Solirubrobacterales bacterium]
MPKINVYVPDDLAAAVRDADLRVSQICQEALAEAVRRVQTARGNAAELRFSETDAPGVSASLAQRVTPRLRNVLEAAHGLAGAGNQVQGLHLLIALVDEPDNMGALMLTTLGVKLAALREIALSRVDTAGSPKTVELDADQLVAGLTRDAKLAVARAVDVAAELGHDYLGCEHLLLGLVHEPVQPAGGLLVARGASLGALEKVLPGLLAATRRAHADESELAARLEQIEQRLSAGGL